MAETKKCTSCGQTKGLSQFPRDQGGKGNRHSRCKVCARQKVSKWYKKNKGRRARYMREYRKRKK